MSPKTKAIVIKVFRALVWIVYALGRDHDRAAVPGVPAATVGSRSVGRFRGVHLSLDGPRDGAVPGHLRVGPAVGRLDTRHLDPVRDHRLQLRCARSRHRPRLDHPQTANRGRTKPVTTPRSRPGWRRPGRRRATSCSLRAPAARPGPLCCRRRQPARTRPHDQRARPERADTRCGRRTCRCCAPTPGRSSRARPAPPSSDSRARSIWQRRGVRRVAAGSVRRGAGRRARCASRLTTSSRRPVSR